MTVKATYLSPGSSARCEFCLEEFFHLDECWSGESGRIAFAPEMERPSGETAPIEPQDMTIYEIMPTAAERKKWNEAGSGSSNDAFPTQELEALAQEFDEVDGLVKAKYRSVYPDMLRRAVASHSSLVDLCVSLRTKLRENGIDP